MSMTEGFYSRYYTEMGTVKSRPFAVWSLGYNRCVARSDYFGFQRRHPTDRRFSVRDGRTLRSVVLVFVSGGHGHFRSGPSGRMQVPANSVFFVFPGVNHFYRYDEETGWDEQWLELDPAAVLPLLREAGVTPESPLRTFNALPTLTSAFGELFDMSRSGRAGSEWLVEAAAHRVLAETLAVWQRGSDDSESPAGRAVERMRQMLIADEPGKGDMAELSRVAGLSPSRLRELFKRATGLSPKRFQLRTRLLRAGRMLKETNLPIAEIALQTGFESLYSFSHRFRSAIGCSPSSYRRKTSGEKDK